MALITNQDGTNVADVDAQGQIKVVLPATQQVNLPSDQILVPKNYYSEVERGNIPGHSRATMDGYNATIGTTYEPIWAISGASYPWLATAQQLTVSSDANTDVYGTGTGAWVVQVQGLDTNWDPITELVNLNGRTPVTTVNSFLRVNGLTAVAVGSAGSNNGAVYVGYGTVTTGVPASILSAIPATENVASQIVYSVPAGYHLEMLGYRASMSAAGRVRFKTKPFGLPWYANYTIPLPATVGIINAVVPLHLPAKTDLLMEALVTTGSGQVGVIIEAVLMETP